MGRRRTSRARWALVGLLALAVVPACGGELGFPDPATDDGDRILGLWRGAVLAGLAVAALIWALVAWSILRYRRRNDDLPSQSHENIPLEIAYTVTPLLIVAVLFAFTVFTQEQVTGAEEDVDLAVEVVGFQWSWEFRYPDLGVEVESTGEGDPVLVLPVGATVRFDLVAEDVDHSFWVPEFLEKRDLIPRVDNHVDVEVTRAGEWTGRCAEFCGLKHWAMRFGVRAVPQDEFDRWVRDEGGRA
jgi:cytochrome c oxidase subunit II